MTLYNDPTIAVQRTELNTRNSSTYLGTIATNTTNIATIGDGRKVVASAGTRETLAASTACKYVVITAEADNTGAIVVGAVTCVATLATRRGYLLNAGEGIGFPIDNLADVYLDSTVTGDGVTFIYMA
jgi:hypothetical protein